jgi:predicted dehydrogenase
MATPHQELSEALRVGLIGCGGISRAHVKGLQMLKEAGVCNLEFTACQDIVLENARKRATEIAAVQGKEPSVYSSLDEMLEKEDSVRAVDICTDHLTHHSAALKCLEARKHVLIEKPLAITIRAGRMIVDAAKRNGRTLAVAENYRRMPANRAINWCIRTGKIGKPRALMWIETSYNLFYWGWRHHRVKAGGGWILDGGVHFADLFLYNLGPVDEVYAVTKFNEPIRYEDWPATSKAQAADVEDLSFATLKFSSGVAGFWGWSSSAPGKGLNHRIIHGDKGSISWNDGLALTGAGNTGLYTASLNELTRQMLQELGDQEKSIIFPGGIGTKTDAWNFDTSVAVELWDFADSVTNHRRPEVDGELGLKDEAISMSVYESATLGEPVKVSEIESGETAHYQEEINSAIGLE